MQVIYRVYLLLGSTLYLPPCHQYNHGVFSKFGIQYHKDLFGLSGKKLSFIIFLFCLDLSLQV